VVQPHRAMYVGRADNPPTASPAEPLSAVDGADEPDVRLRDAALGRQHGAARRADDPMDRPAVLGAAAPTNAVNGRAVMDALPMSAMGATASPNNSADRSSLESICVSASRWPADWNVPHHRKS